MTLVTDIREGIAANLVAVKGLQVSAYMLSRPTPPSAHVIPAEVSYDETMRRGMDDYILTVQVFVAYVADVAAQQRLDGFLASSGATSVKAAIESDRTLGGKVDDLRVTGASGYQVFTLDTAQYLGVEFRIEVLATG